MKPVSLLAYAHAHSRTATNTGSQSGRSSQQPLTDSLTSAAGLYPWRNDHLLRPRQVVTTRLEKEFTAIAEGRPGGGIAIKLPFDPSAAWGDRERYDVTGTINGHKVRGKLTSRAGRHVLERRPAERRGRTGAVGAEIVGSIAPECPRLGAR